MFNFRHFGNNLLLNIAPQISAKSQNSKSLHLLGYAEISSSIALNNKSNIRVVNGTFFPCPSLHKNSYIALALFPAKAFSAFIISSKFPITLSAKFLKSVCLSLVAEAVIIFGKSPVQSNAIFAQSTNSPTIAAQCESSASISKILFTREDTVGFPMRPTCANNCPIGVSGCSGISDFTTTAATHPQ